MVEDNDYRKKTWVLRCELSVRCYLALLQLEANPMCAAECEALESTLFGIRINTRHGRQRDEQ
jgi:hypothetical protein